MVANHPHSSSSNHKKAPLISFVIAGRNDNYGGDFKSRLERCILSLYEQLITNNVPSEIIFVNYNPLPTPAITDFIAWPKATENIQIKIITVPAQMHQELISNHTIKEVPVLEYPAKNAGIVRAKGDFILAMNPDIIFDSAFFKAVFNLKKGTYYRCNRYDFQLKNDEIITGDCVTFAKNNCTKIWVKAIAKEIKKGRVSRFKLAQIIAQQKVEILRYSMIRAFNFLWKIKLHPKAEYKYHCNVSGDFMLLHKEHWSQLRAYKEHAFMSLHMDALFVVQAATLGLKEVVFSFPIYHQEHERRYNATQENPDFRAAYLSFQKEAQLMIKNKKPSLYNSEDWGLSNAKLEEILL